MRRPASAGLIALALLAAAALACGSDPGSAATGANPTAMPPAGSQAAADWWSVLFTDPARESPALVDRLIATISTAERSIYVAGFALDYAPVVDALLAARARGVDVRWVTDDEYGLEDDEYDGNDFFPALEAAGIPVRDDGRRNLMHNKFWVFDAELVWTGSTNITYNGFFRNNNNAIMMRSPELAAIYTAEFNEMWAGQFGPESPSTINDQFVTVNGTDIQVLFGPEDRAVDYLSSIMTYARERIVFMAFSFTNDDLGDAMRAQAATGVSVTGIFEERNSEDEYSELSPFYCAGFDVRQDGNPAIMHHKVIVIDDDIVVTGSLNFSNNANRYNDENVMILTNREIAAAYLAEFDRRWAEARPPNPADLGCD